MAIRSLGKREARDRLAVQAGANRSKVPAHGRGTGKSGRAGTRAKR